MPGNLENVTFYANSSPRRFLCLQRIWKFCDGHICALSKECRQWRLNWKSQNDNFVKSDKYFVLAKGPISWEDVCLHFQSRRVDISFQIDLNQTAKRFWQDKYETLCKIMRLYLPQSKYEIWNIKHMKSFKLYVRLWDCICHGAIMKNEI